MADIEDRERRYRAIFETTMEGFVMLDKGGRTSEVNDAYIQLMGYDREELMRLQCRA